MLKAMAFNGHLPQAQLNDLIAKAVDSDLLSGPRQLLGQGILRSFWLTFTVVGDPLTQFQLDLATLNNTERLANGEVPLVQFLKNAANQLRLRGRPEADDFEAIAQNIGNRTFGVPPMPNPQLLREVVQNEAIVGVDDMVDFAFLAKGIRVGQSVARIIVPRFEGGVLKQANNGPWTMVGTAWVLAPTLMLTNHHVIAARLTGEPEPSPADFALQAGGSVVEFDFDAPGSVVKKIAVTKVEADSIDLDYSVIRLVSDAGRPALGFNPQRVVFGPASYDPVNIIQHPRGQPKRIAFRNNLLTGADNETIRYFTDTDFGSSGSPVCDDNWRVVALHRGAEFVKGVTFQGKSTAYVNFGSQLQAVLDKLQAQNADIHAELQQAQAAIS
jgi:V8-like Glu-specific endopeptidase